MESLAEKIFYYREGVLSESPEHERTMALGIIDLLVQRVRDAEATMNFKTGDECGREFCQKCEFINTCSLMPYLVKYTEEL